MVRLLIALAVGAILALGATYITSSVLAGVANGNPANQSLYNYGSR